MTAHDRTMSAPAPLLAISALDVVLGRTTILKDVTLSIVPGEIVTIVGPNGSGKSTLLRAALGAVRPAAGNVWRKPGLRLGYVPQKLHIEPALPLSVRRFLGLPVRVSQAQARDALESAGAGGLETHQMISLSGGQMQRVLLARALLNRPELLILDEPTQALDQPGAAAFYRRIAQLRETTGCAVLMVSHDLHVVMAASDRVICLNRHICCQGEPEHVASAPQYRALFGTGTGGALALYRHQHDHAHDHAHDSGGAPVRGTAQEAER